MLIGAFWRYALRGLAMVFVVGIVGITATFGWHALIVAPQQRAQQSAACAAFSKSHPGFVRAAAGATLLSWDQAMDPCQ